MLDKIYAVVETKTLKPLALGTRKRKYYTRRHNAVKAAKMAVFNNYYNTHELSVAEYGVVIMNKQPLTKD